MIAENKSDDPTVCQTCGEKLVYLWGEDLWACMDLSHGRLLRAGCLSKKDAVVTRSGATVGEDIRRGLKKMAKDFPKQPPTSPARTTEPQSADPELVARYLELAAKLEHTSVTLPPFRVWAARINRP